MKQKLDVLTRKTPMRLALAILVVASPDGKFYVRGTNRECNPGKQDRAKLKQ